MRSVCESSSRVDRPWRLRPRRRTGPTEVSRKSLDLLFQPLSSPHPHPVRLMRRLYNPALFCNRPPGTARAEASRRLLGGSEETICKGESQKERRQEDRAREKGSSHPEVRSADPRQDGPAQPFRQQGGCQKQPRTRSNPESSTCRPASPAGFNRP